MEGEEELEKSHCENCPLSRMVNQIGYMYLLREGTEKCIGQEEVHTGTVDRRGACIRLERHLPGEWF